MKTKLNAQPVSVSRGIISVLTDIHEDKFNLRRFSTAANYRSTMRSVCSFTNGHDIPIEDITHSWVESYEFFLKQRGAVRNTSSFYMRVLRAAYNRELREHPFPTCGNPFEGIYSGIDHTVKRSVGMDGVAKMVSLKKKSGVPDIIKDLFLFSFYSRGMSLVDMSYLKWSDYSDGRIRYFRKKTGQMIDMKVEPCMMKIMERYRNPDSKYVFPIIRTDDPYEAHCQHRSFLLKYNRCLKNAAKSIGFTQTLTSYCSRHTWASVCRDSGMPLSSISNALGHTSEKTTRIYLSQMDKTVVDKGNEKMLKLLRQRCASLEKQ